MPTYDYKCENCDHMFEYFQAMSDLPLKNVLNVLEKYVDWLVAAQVSFLKGVGFISPIMLKRIQMIKKQKSQRKQKRRKL